MASGTASKPAAKPAPKPPPEIKEIIAPSLQSARIRCDRDDCGHAKPGTKVEANQIPTGWFRGLFVLLAKKPPPPPPPKEGEQPAVPAKPVFTLWITDGDGYLSPIAGESEGSPPTPPPPQSTPAGASGSSSPAAPPAAGTPPADPPPPPPPELPEAPGAIAGTEDSVKLVAGEKYLLYLVMHPKIEVAQEFLKQANDKGIPDGQNFLKELDLERERTGETTVDKKANTKTIVEEPVFKVKDTLFLTEPGAELYSGFFLFSQLFQRKFFANDRKGVQFSTVLPFMAMPNNYCPYIKDQVVRLQAHLGALRFPVGSNGNPYFSVRQDVLTVALKGPNDKSAQDYKIVFENPGVFDALTYNAVLAFQRHSKDGRYVKLKDGPALYGQMFDGDLYEPKKAGAGLVVADAAVARKLSVDYLKLDPDSATPWTAAGLGSPQLSDEVEGAVDTNTAKEIKRWLKDGLRKQGHVMRAAFPTGSLPDGRPYDKGGKSEWMRDDAVPLYVEWISAVHSMNAPQDVLGTHVFRDIRDMVTGTAPGKIRNSIHKTGLAVDTAPVNGFMNQHPAYAPIVIMEPQQVTIKGKQTIKIRWRLFEEVSKGFSEAVHGKARDDFARAKGVDPATLFRRRLTPWKFDSARPDGGETGPPVEGLFLDITAVAAAIGWERISAQSGMGAQASSSVKIESTKKKNIQQAVAEAIAAIEGAKAQSGNLDILVDRSGSVGPVLGRAGGVDTELLKKWMFTMSVEGFTPVPEVRLDNPLGTPVDRDKFQQVLHDFFGSEPMIVKMTSRFGESSIGVGQASDVFPAIEDGIVAVVPLLGVIWIESGDTVTTSKVGIPRTREWWHFQHDESIGNSTDDQSQWFQALSQIGWEREGLSALGYIAEDLDPPKKK